MQMLAGEAYPCVQLMVIPPVNVNTAPFENVTTMVFVPTGSFAGMANLAATVLFVGRLVLVPATSPVESCSTALETVAAGAGIAGGAVRPMVTPVIVPRVAVPPGTFVQ